MLNSTRSAFACSVWISEQTAIISLYSINCLVFITETESVYCAVRTESETVHGSASAPSVHTEVPQQRFWRGIRCYCPWRQAQVFCLLVYTSHTMNVRLASSQHPTPPPPKSKSIKKQTFRVVRSTDTYHDKVGSLHSSQ